MCNVINRRLLSTGVKIAALLKNDLKILQRLSRYRFPPKLQTYTTRNGASFILPSKGQILPQGVKIAPTR